MYCKYCGNRLEGDAAFCEKCGRPVEITSAFVTNPTNTEDGPEGGERVWSGGGYQSYEYARTTVSRDLSQVAIDCYGSLGYELTGQQETAVGKQTTLSFRRSRKVRGKAQLAKIQRVMDDSLASISRLENEKGRTATMRASMLGILAALVLGVGMCCSMVWDGLMAIGVVVGITFSIARRMRQNRRTETRRSKSSTTSSRPNVKRPKPFCAPVRTYGSRTE